MVCQEDFEVLECFGSVDLNKIILDAAAVHGQGNSGERKSVDRKHLLRNIRFYIQIMIARQFLQHGQGTGGVSEAMGTDVVGNTWQGQSAGLENRAKRQTPTRNWTGVLLFWGVLKLAERTQFGEGVG